MNRKVVMSKDGSSTIFWEEMDEHYHSIHGAIQESKHVFIEAGFNAIEHKACIHVLEIGFGTGLNALLTLIEAASQKKQIVYHTLEQYPIAIEHVKQLNYIEKIDVKWNTLFDEIHESSWEQSHQLTDHFTFKKIKTNFLNYRNIPKFDLIYFDAFAPSSQPELWVPSIFQNMYNALLPGGHLVTYCAKGQVKRDLKQVGFEVVALPGPPGKREMTKAIKPNE